MEDHVEVRGVVVVSRGKVAVVVVGVVGVVVVVAKVGLVEFVLVEWVEVYLVVVSEVVDDHSEVDGAPECVLEGVLVVWHVEVGHIGLW